MKVIDKLIAIASEDSCTWWCSECPLTIECERTIASGSESAFRYIAMQQVIKHHKKQQRKE